MNFVAGTINLACEAALPVVFLRMNLRFDLDFRPTAVQSSKFALDQLFRSIFPVTCDKSEGFVDQE